MTYHTKTILDAVVFSGTKPECLSLFSPEESGLFHQTHTGYGYPLWGGDGPWFNCFAFETLELNSSAPLGAASNSIRRLELTIGHGVYDGDRPADWNVQRASDAVCTVVSRIVRLEELAIRIALSLHDIRLEDENQPYMQFQNKLFESLMAPFLKSLSINNAMVLAIDKIPAMVKRFESLTFLEITHSSVLEGEGWNPLFRALAYNNSLKEMRLEC
jgi:hypothetical protein